MLWVVMNILCFVNLVLMLCWNLHMHGFQIYTWYSYSGEFGLNMKKIDPIVWEDNHLYMSYMDDGLKAPWQDAPPCKL